MSKPLVVALGRELEYPEGHRGGEPVAGETAGYRRAASVQKARDDVDSETDDDRPEEVRHEGVSKRDPADSSRHEVRVGDLECQPDGERDVGEVEVVRPLVGVEVDPATVARAVVLPRVAQREDRVHAGKGERNAQHAECN